MIIKSEVVFKLNGPRNKQRIDSQRGIDIADPNVSRGGVPAIPKGIVSDIVHHQPAVQRHRPFRTVPQLNLWIESKNLMSSE